MITVKVGARSYEVTPAGEPIVPPGKYPPGDARRLGPQYVHYQRSSRIREERRGRMSEHARKNGFSSLGAMYAAQKLTGGERAPKHAARTKALGRDARARDERPSKFSQALAKGLAAIAHARDVLARKAEQARARRAAKKGVTP